MSDIEASLYLPRRPADPTFRVEMRDDTRDDGGGGAVIPPRILVVDEQQAVRRVLQSILDEKGCEVRCAESAEQALATLGEFEPAAALVDIALPGMNGIRLLGEIKQHRKDTEVLVMTGNASAETAVQAMRQGAYDYLQKPFEDLEQVWIAVNRALEKRALTLKNRAMLDQQDRRNRELSSAVSLHPGREDGDDFASCSELLEFFTDLVAARLDVERVSLMLLDGKGELSIAASRGLEHIDVAAVRVPLGHGIAGSVAQSGEPFVMKAPHPRGAMEDPRLIEPDPFMPAPVAFCVPINSDGEVLGVINATNRRSGKHFREGDIEHLLNLADQLAGAIMAARRSHRLQEAYESLKDTQHQLVFSERVKAIGQMAAGVAHDFNNALSVIMGRAQLALMKARTPSTDLKQIDRDLETIVKTAKHGAETIKRIQDYTRMRKDMPLAPVDLNNAVKDAIDISRPKWKEEPEAHGIAVSIRKVLNSIPPVSGNQYELTQVVGNFLFNAVEAMPKGGTLTFRTFTEGESVVLEVEDTGTGMDADTRQRLFEPFFTTKQSGQGLGMSIVHGIVFRHRGEIEVESEVGRGTRFRVRLPVLPAMPEQEHPATSTPSIDPARVLLVDDDPMVLATYEEALAAHGHDVVAVLDAERALSAFEQGIFDVVITDLSMAGMSGLELAAELRMKRPLTRVVLLTGWAERQPPDRLGQRVVDEIVVKPCTIEELLATIQSLVATPTAK